MILVVEFQIDDKWVKKVVDLGNKIEAGSTELVAGFANGSLSDQEAIAPAGLLSLLIYRLCGDVAHNQEPDLVLNSYQQSLDFLVSLFLLDVYHVLSPKVAAKIV